MVLKKYFLLVLLGGLGQEKHAIANWHLLIILGERLD